MCSYMMPFLSYKTMWMKWSLFERHNTSPFVLILPIMMPWCSSELIMITSLALALPNFKLVNHPECNPDPPIRAGSSAAAGIETWAQLLRRVLAYQVFLIARPSAEVRSALLRTF